MCDATRQSGSVRRVLLRRADRDPADTGDRSYPGSFIEHLALALGVKKAWSMTKMNDDQEVIVTIGGEEFAVKSVEVLQGGERRQLSDLAPKTQDRILRGIRNFLLVEPLAALTVRQIREVQGFAIDHDRGAIDDHVARMARGAGGEFADAFDPPGAAPVTWESPPCEYVARQKIQIPSAPCNECGVDVSADQWDVHACDPVARARHQEAK